MSLSERVSLELQELQSLFQSILVSGTNIKTVNGTSLLGSGDITISGGGGTWGSITGTLSSQTDLQAALDAKQATLVSASNIKTINGTSLLGSGDISTGGTGPTTLRRVVLGSNVVSNSTTRATVSGWSLSIEAGK